jgi:pyrimidine operon attenuation protein/uracil phosphoribosyltransferase
MGPGQADAARVLKPEQQIGEAVLAIAGSERGLPMRPAELGQAIAWARSQLVQARTADRPQPAGSAIRANAEPK